MDFKKIFDFKIVNFLKTLLIIFLIAAILGAAVKFLRDHETFLGFEDDSDEKTLNLVPSEAWAEDGSCIGAYIWSNDNTSEFILLNDDDKNGVYTIRIDNKFSKITFVDLELEKSNLGLNWSNVREQTEELLIPTDEKTYYHQYANEWSNSGNKLFMPTRESIQVAYVCNDEVIPVIYYFDKYGINEPSFLKMNELSEMHYYVDIPAGYTHIIFIEYLDEVSIGTWDNIVKKSEELLIPTDHNNIFIANKNIWVNKFE